MGALDVTKLGRSVHHQDRVLDQYEIERYTVEVPDGYATETCTVRHELRIVSP